MIIRIQCEICTHHVANADTARLALPIRGAMFDPPGPGYPPPFVDDVDWIWMRCPMCAKRPFLEEGRFLLMDRSELSRETFYTIEPPEPVQEREVQELAEVLPAPTTFAQVVPEDKILEAIFLMADSGLTTGEISKKLAERGIEMHRAGIMAKLRKRDRDRERATGGQGHV